VRLPLAEPLDRAALVRRMEAEDAAAFRANEAMLAARQRGLVHAEAVARRMRNTRVLNRQALWTVIEALDAGVVEGARGESNHQAHQEHQGRRGPSPAGARSASIGVGAASPQGARSARPLGGLGVLGGSIPLRPDARDDGRGPA